MPQNMHSRQRDGTVQKRNLNHRWAALVRPDFITTSDPSLKRSADKASTELLYEFVVFFIILLELVVFGWNAEADGVLPFLFIVMDDLRFAICRTLENILNQISEIFSNL